MDALVIGKRYILSNVESVIMRVEIVNKDNDASLRLIGSDNVIIMSPQLVNCFSIKEIK